MTSFVHLTARMSPLSPPLHHEDAGAWLWHGLREAFPGALALTLMPDHPHLVVPAGVAIDQRLAGLLGPWVSATRLAAALGICRRGFEARHHAYVSADPHASITGTPMPRTAPPVDIASIPLQSLIDAVAAATRSKPDAITRKGTPRALLVALALDQGWRQTSLLARVAGCSPRTIQRLAQSIDPRGLAAARLCAADVRLRDLPPRDGNRDVRTA